NKWYIAAINGENKEKTIHVNLPMLKGKNTKIIKDSQNSDSELMNKKFSGNTELDLKLAPNGGTVIYEL
ncbi:glycoside hydrolase family 97 C-terminal domain-containing protein, partial [Flavobacterium sp.]|uniref:glycoside hydrolase family 97 C-terminal domain-containing protein n=1 Tax=Flavobacterium sp. TaxID=239 RepID=UPI002ED99867